MNLGITLDTEHDSDRVPNLYLGQFQFREISDTTRFEIETATA